MMVPAFEGPAIFGIRGSGRNPDRWESQGQLKTGLPKLSSAEARSGSSESPTSRGGTLHAFLRRNVRDAT